VPHENISTILTPWFSLICSSWPGAANPRRDAREYSFKGVQGVADQHSPLRWRRPSWT
jgi:hypothetical protein